jgi:hypothetical protein
MKKGFYEFYEKARQNREASYEEEVADARRAFQMIYADEKELT